MSDDSLKCRVPGCGKVIRGWTGLDELTKLRQHMRRAHLTEWDTHQALLWRARWELEQYLEEQRT